MFFHLPVARRVVVARLQPHIQLVLAGGQAQGLRIVQIHPIVNDRVVLQDDDAVETGLRLEFDLALVKEVADERRAGPERRCEQQCAEGDVPEFRPPGFPPQKGPKTQ